MLERIKNSIERLAKSKRVDEQEVRELIKDVQRSLLEADVNVRLVFELSNRIKERALKEEPPKGLTRREFVINTVYEELVNLLGEKPEPIELKPQKILLVGLYGSGKTTTAWKLARFLQKRGLSTGVISCDTWRPAAYEQLRQLCEKEGIEVYGDEKEKDPVKIVERGLEKFSKKKVVIVDSAGRSAFDDELARELERVKEALEPDEVLLVISGDIGQAAGSQAEKFHELVGLTGVIVTKMDSSAKGGGALSACHAAGVKIRMIGTGEKAGDLEQYDPVRFVSRLLGMGDLQALIEKAREAIEPEEAMDLLSQDLNFETFYKQIEASTRVGSLDKILELLPFGGRLGIPKEELEKQEEMIRKWKYIIDSMTIEERRNPDVFKGSKQSRFERIARGSGTTVEDVRELYKALKKTRKMMKMLRGVGKGKMDEKKLAKMLRRMGALLF